jgi:hypothetical protein
MLLKRYFTKKRQEIAKVLIKSTDKSYNMTKEFQMMFLLYIIAAPALDAIKQSWIESYIQADRMKQRREALIKTKVVVKPEIISQSETIAEAPQISDFENLYV